MTEIIAARTGAIDTRILKEDLDGFGYSRISGLLTARACAELAALYPSAAPFRSHIHMARHGFGKGEYKYFAYPLPRLIASLREAFFRLLVPIANEWNERMGIDVRYPEEHDAYLDLCHAAGQTRPTPLLLRYGEGDFNRLHQDVYGELLFPLQVAVLLSRPNEDFTGGEFVLTEQRPRMQSRAEVVALEQGDAIVFPVRHRPVRGSRGNYRVNMRHGVSRLHSGTRHALGIIFHDAA